MGLHIIDLSTGRPFDEDVSTLPKLSEGKTKINWDLGGEEIATTHKPILTAFDKPEYSGTAIDKGPPSAISTAILYKLLEQTGVATAHKGIINGNTTREMKLNMLPFEFIWRTYNDKKSSRHERFPQEALVGAKYPEVIHEIGLKWSVIDEKTGNEESDPFLVLDDEGNPITDEQGMPFLVGQKTGRPIEYKKVIYPGKPDNEISREQVLEGMQNLRANMPTIREYRQTIQQKASEMYGEIGLLNLDGKWEGGVDSKGKFRVGDTIELDSMRLALLRKFMSGDKEHETEHTLGTSLESIIAGGAAAITRILASVPTSKQDFRDKVKALEKLIGEARREANNEAASAVVKAHYIPVAMALSKRFGEEVGYILKAA